MVKVKIIMIGAIAQELSDNKILGWKSNIFSICKDIVKINLNAEPDLAYNRGFSDKNLISSLPPLEQINAYSANKEYWDITFYVMSVPLENNYYSRILDDNRVIISYNWVKELLKEEEIPLEHFLLRLIYAYTLLYMVKKGKNMSIQDEEYLSHEDSRRCIFDMCGSYRDISYSVISPRVCEECAGKLVSRNFPNDKIQIIQKELKGLTLSWYSRLRLKLKQQPILSLIVTALSSIILTIIANYIWNWIS